MKRMENSRNSTMNTYISVPVVKDQEIVYKRIAVPNNTSELSNIIKNIDEANVDFLANQLENSSLSVKNER
jgi:hypothetical protein